jgi:hypothetical protein
MIGVEGKEACDLDSAQDRARLYLSTYIAYASLEEHPRSAGRNAVPTSSPPRSTPRQLRVQIPDPNPEKEANRGVSDTSLGVSLN